MKSAGLDDVIQRSLAHYIVVLELPALFKGDMPDSDALGLFTYVSCEHDTHRKAQEEACLTVLTFLLTIAPQQVLIAPNSMGDIDRVRAEAAMFRQTCDPPASGTWFARYTHLHNASQPAQTFPRQSRGVTSSLPTKRNVRNATVMLSFFCKRGWAASLRRTHVFASPQSESSSRP